MAPEQDATRPVAGREGFQCLSFNDQILKILLNLFFFLTDKSLHVKVVRLVAIFK